MTPHERIKAYNDGMNRLQKIWAYLLVRKTRLYRLQPSAAKDWYL